MNRVEPMPLDEFRRQLGKLAEGRSDEELAQWRSFVDWVARTAIEKARRRRKRPGGKGRKGKSKPRPKDKRRRG